MLVQILDAGGEPHFVSWQGQDQINDFSGALGASAVGAAAAPQQIAPANTSRAGFLFQNTSPNAMALYEDGTTVSPWIVNSGALFPPYPGYPIPTGAISVVGLVNVSQVGDTFTYRDWQNASGE